jgi:hypothetical protein
MDSNDSDKQPDPIPGPSRSIVIIKAPPELKPQDSAKESNSEVIREPVKPRNKYWELLRRLYRDHELIKTTGFPSTRHAV